MKPIVSRSLSVHVEHELLLRLEKAGLDRLGAQMIIGSKNNELAKKVVAYIERGGSEASTSLKRAREIMGKNFLSPWHVARHFHVVYGNQIHHLWEIPFSESELKQCKDTHILFAGYPLTILDIREQVSRQFFVGENNSWYKKLAFVTADKVKMRWYLMRRNIVPVSGNLTFTEQEMRLSKYEEIPRTCEVVYMCILMYLATKESLFQGVYAQCRDSTKDGGRVSIRSFSTGGLELIGYDISGPQVGIAASRKISN